MPTFYDHISATNKTAIRKTLRVTLEEQFAQTTSLVDELCKDICTERIYPQQCLGKYGDIQNVLREIEVTFANYVKSRKRAIGVAKDEADHALLPIE